MKECCKKNLIYAREELGKLREALESGRIIVARSQQGGAIMRCVGCGEKYTVYPIGED